MKRTSANTNTDLNDSAEFEIENRYVTPLCGPIIFKNEARQTTVDSEDESNKR